ncbi:MAG: beta-ketoacyl-[acyl-carrier-protein] synthase family protein [Candidatus Omnitrophota bacterium]|nr:beta-ketoacyl-[acyl-carrier-protein] synthase family protein [Candidatus Omnitrophota bacterium]
MGYKNRRVVVTGLGIVSSIGIGWRDFWQNLIKGKSGISKITSFDTKEYDRHFGGEVKDFKPEEFIDRRKIKRMGRSSQLAVSASKLALEDARLKIKDIAKQRAGVCVGTTMGESQLMEHMDRIWTTRGDKYIDSMHIFLYPTSIIPTEIAQEFKLHANNLIFSNACAAGNYSIGYAFDLIKNERADLMLAGGVDAFSRINFVGFGRLYAIAPEICQPFDKNRKGMLVSEGAGMLVLESLESALKRKAPIYAEILGYGLSCDAYQMTTASVEGVAECLKKSLRESNIKPEDVDYISAHGTGTPTNDKVECAAIKNVFKNYKKIPISSIKSMLGHTMGAAAAIEAIVCCLTIKNGIIPPTINYETADPNCDIDCVPNEARKQTVNIALNNSQAFGGNNACVVLRKFVR